MPKLTEVIFKQPLNLILRFNNFAKNIDTKHYHQIRTLEQLRNNAASQANERRDKSEKQIISVGTIHELSRLREKRKNTMKYNPRKHNRHSIRLKNYDYSSPGLYFITLNTQNREQLFGQIIDGKMILNEFGQIVDKF